MNTFLFNCFYFSKDKSKRKKIKFAANSAEHAAELFIKDQYKNKQKIPLQSIVVVQALLAGKFKRDLSDSPRYEVRRCDLYFKDELIDHIFRAYELERVSL